MPALLGALGFRSNNEAHKPVIEAVALARRYMGAQARTYPKTEVVPLKGIVRPEWWAFVVEATQRGEPRVNRINYEICVLQVLREKLRCKEVWVVGAERHRNPDEDLPQDFDAKRIAYYAALAQPLEPQTFTNRVRAALEAGLEALDHDLSTSQKVQIVTSKNGKGRFKVSPLEPQPSVPNLKRIKATLTGWWPMTSLLDILKETELRVELCQAFRTVASRESLSRDVLRRRLLLCLHGLGTNTGLKRVASGGGQDSYGDLLHVRRRFIHPDQLREAISRVVNAIFDVRQAGLWGEATTACASDSRKFGAFDQNLMTEWHARYCGPGVMIYWHVERHSVCIYSQLKSCSSSEVAAMIEGVLRYDTSMEVEKNYVDTHGQSEVAFAFTHLLGFQLLPRLKNIRKQKLYRPRAGAPEAYPNLKSVLTRPIDWVLIEQQYDEMVKFATALRLGTASAESILRRFTRLNVQHPTYQALAELGKALKTTFLCDYLPIEGLRREVHEGLNVIETWNSANDFILYGKGGDFASNRREDQEVAMLSLHLLQISLVFVNTLMIQRVLEGPEWEGRLTPEDLRALTPLLWGHVNPYGVFRLDMSERIRIEDQAAD